jgi:tRNA dimethylallyltransferase
MNKPLLILVAGATAVGKTDLCIRLAQHLDTEIISADSRQLFKEMSIGTAKPSQEEMQNVVHHFVDSHSVKEEYNVAKYEKEVLTTLEEVFSRKKTSIFTGGSGLYINAVCQGLDDMPEIDEKIKTQLQADLEEKGLDFLVEKLRNIDPVYFETVDKANSRRVLRALEVSLSAQKPYSSFRKKKYKERPFRIAKILLKRERSELHERINKRVDLMLENGLLEEVKNLFEFRHLKTLQTVGYREIFGFLEGQYDYEEAIRLVKRNTRRYARRQETWFRKDEEYKIFHPDEYEKVLAYVKTLL